MTDFLQHVRNHVKAYTNLKTLLPKDYTASGFRVVVYHLGEDYAENPLADMQIAGETKDEVFKALLKSLEYSAPLQKSLLKSALKDLEVFKEGS